MKRFELGLGAALLGSAACLTLVAGEAAPASGAASRTVTVSLSDNGKGRWSIDGDAEKGTLALNYNWKGTLKFKVPAKAFQNKRFLAKSSGVLRGNWTGDFVGTKFGIPYNGPYHCQYAGKNVPGAVTAELTTGAARGTLELTLHASGEEGFFVSKGRGATATCSSGYGVDGPSHFEPQWLFRDTTTDHARMTSDTAVIVLPARSLAGASVTLKWPREIGKVSSPFRDKLVWNNVGKLVAKTS
jgi:hypothetical protein